MPVAVFHGTEAECQELLSAISRTCQGTPNCSCHDGTPCSGKLLMIDQRAMDALLWIRRTHQSWERVEESRDGTLLQDQQFMAELDGSSPWPARMS